MDLKRKKDFVALLLYLYYYNRGSDYKMGGFSDEGSRRNQG